MQIRSITCFGDPRVTGEISRLGGAAREGIAAFGRVGTNVQTVRLATPSFTKLVAVLEPTAAVEFALMMEAEAGKEGFEYISLGPATPDKPESYALIAEMLERTKNTFATGVIAEREGGIWQGAIRRCAETIVRLKDSEANGFGNLYFAALANVPARAPFFPAAYQEEGEKAGFALALEAADLAVEVFNTVESAEDGRQRLIRRMEEEAKRLTAVGDQLAEKHGVRFYGLDFTLAPFPEQGRSVGTAVEALSGTAVGGFGSLAAVAFLADSIDRARYRKTGFNGLMLPVLEDATLARRGAEGTLTVKDLLMYSAVCGTGLDTIPLPGDVTTKAIEGVLLDMAALAKRLDKPLTARLLPVPGKKAGEKTAFDFPFFANSRILALEIEKPASGGLFAGAEEISVQPRRSRE